MSAAQPPSWVLEEVASAGRENLDVDHVRSYDDKEDADADAEVALLQPLGLGPGAQVVDLGAGTGQFTLAAARTGANVVAVDVSPVMIHRLNAKIQKAGLDNVEVVHAGFLTYQPTGALADVVYSRFALHHLPDFWKALALDRIHGMLRSGGVLRLWDVVYDFDPDQAEARLDAWCAAFDGAAEGEWSRADVEEHIRDEHSTFRWLLEPMLDRCGFEIRDVAYSPDGLFGRYVTHAR